MNRRNFFQLLGAAAPLLFLPKVIDPVRWKVLGPSGIWVPNPAWVNAPLEFLHGEAGGYWSRDRIEHPRPEDSDVPKDKNERYPLRYALTDPVTYLPVFIPPFIQR